MLEESTLHKLFSLHQLTMNVGEDLLIARTAKPLFFWLLSETETFSSVLHKLFVLITPE